MLYISVEKYQIFTLRICKNMKYYDILTHVRNVEIFS